MEKEKDEMAEFIVIEEPISTIIFWRNITHIIEEKGWSTIYFSNGMSYSIESTKEGVIELFRQ